MVPHDPSRRTVLGALGATLGTAGCLGGQSTPTRTATRSPVDHHTATVTHGSTTGTDAATGTEAGWSSAWVETFDGNVVSLDAHRGTLYAAASRDSRDCTFCAVDPTDGRVRWRQTVDGEALGPGPNEADEPDDGWGAWFAAGRAHLVTGRHDEWSALRTFDLADGWVAWSLRRDRLLQVRGVVDGTLYATGEELFVPAHTHDTPSEPLTSVVYAVDAATGTVQWTDRFDGVGGVGVGPAGVAVHHGTQVTLLSPDGTRQWSTDLGGEGVRAYLADGVVLTVTRIGEETVVRGFDLDGRRLWKHRAPDVSGADALLAGGTLYLGGGSMLAVRPDGRVRWRHSRPGGWFLREPSTGRLYVRGGRAAGSVSAYAADGSHRWTFDPPSTNAWPDGLTASAVLATAITGDQADEPFYTTYVVDPGTGAASKLVAFDSLFAVEGVGETAYLAVGPRIHAFEP